VGFIIIKWVLKKWDGRVWAGFSWPCTGPMRLTYTIKELLVAHCWEVRDSLSELQLRKDLFHGNRYFAKQTVAHTWDTLSVCFGLVSDFP
jgi:hypothetical protein